jgi:hypothetical protein
VFVGEGNLFIRQISDKALVGTYYNVEPTLISKELV